MPNPHRVASGVAKPSVETPTVAHERPEERADWSELSGDPLAVRCRRGSAGTQVTERLIRSLSVLASLKTAGKEVLWRADMQASIRLGQNGSDGSPPVQLKAGASPWTMGAVVDAAAMGVPLGCAHEGAYPAAG